MDEVPMIGVGVTTYRRPEMFIKFRENFNRFATLDEDQLLVVVVDDSQTKRGVAASKNKCIARLMEDDRVEHLFLFDEDTWPVAEHWWIPYVWSTQPHLSYLFKPRWDPDARLEVKDSYLFAHPMGNGCMQYFSRSCIETVGGFRPQFGRWGYEHLEHSWRIWKMGLTIAPFQGLVAQEGLFYASDEHEDNISAVPDYIRKPFAQERNADLYRYWRDKKEFVPYE